MGKKYESKKGVKVLEYLDGKKIGLRNLKRGTDRDNYRVSSPEDLVLENRIARLLDSQEMSEWLGCTVKHVRNLVFRREIPFIKVGRLVRFEQGAIRVWLKNRSHNEYRNH